MTGGRQFRDRSYLFGALSVVHKAKGIDCIIHGDAVGADEMAGEWAVAHGIAVIVEPITARDWDIYGGRAGNVRNQRMLDLGKPDLVVAFPGRSGTFDMVSRARENQIPVIRCWRGKR